jgi:hypothetical protein
MTRFTALSDDHQLRGILIIAYKNAIESEEYAGLFAKHGLAHIEHDEWYPAQQLLDVFSDMLDDDSQDKFDFVSIGIASALSLGFPPDIDRSDPEQVLRVLVTIHASVVRTSHPGYVHIERHDDRHFRVNICSAFPDDVLYGSLYTIATNIMPEPSHIYIAYPDGGKRHDFGDEFTMYDVMWE